MREDAPPRDDARSRFSTLPISSQGENKGAPRAHPAGASSVQTAAREQVETPAVRRARGPQLTRPLVAGTAPVRAARVRGAPPDRNAEMRTQKPVRSVSPPPCSPPSHKHDAAIGPMLSRITE